MAASLIDRFVGWIDPHRGLARHFARQRLARAYEAASPRDGWRPRRAGASANADHAADAGAIRSKARALYQNVPYITAGIDGHVAATVGTGILPRATGRGAEKLNALLADWSKVCDADGQLDLAGLTAAAHRAMEIDGEVLVRLRPRRLSDGLPVPLQLQLLEIDWLDSSKTGVNGGNAVVNGIEYDPLGKRVAYWLFDAHPGDAATFAALRRSASSRVPADKIIHLYSPARPGQGRGFSRLAPVIARVRDLQLYEDAEIARKNLESRLSVLASGDVAGMRAPPGEEDPQKGLSDLGDLASGGITQLPPGVNVTVVEPTAAPGYTDYVKHQLHLIAAGMTVPYEMLTGDMREVNFSSARVRLLDYRRSVQQLQWLVLIPKLLDRIWRAFVDAAELAGSVAVADYSVDYSPPKWDYVNPEQDVKADIAEISAGLSTLSEKLRIRGYNPETVFAEYQQDIERLKAGGIFDVLMFLQRGTTPDAQQQQAAGQSARALEDLQGLLQRMEQRLAAMEQRAPELHVHAGDVTVAQAPAPAVTVAAPEVRTDVHVPAQPAPVVHVAAPEVRTDVHVPAQPAPVVHVAAPNVEVRNDVPPAQVVIPPRTTTTEVVRDDRNNIVRTIQREETAQ